MSFVSEFKNKIFDIHFSNFEKHALDVFRFQAEHNKVYREYVSLLNINVEKITTVSQIPFLPIRFFKDLPHGIKSVDKVPVRIFRSSGTTGMSRSEHMVFDEHFYHQVTLKGFEAQYGPVKTYDIIALLPNYQENPDSSLISMIDYFIEQSESTLSGFYDQLSVKDALLNNTGRKKLLIGVSFALLDLADEQPAHVNDLIVMETGGMKGRRKEMIRKELHEILQKRLGVPQIHSEYGMSELLSQAYSREEAGFRCPGWMKVFIRDVYDPFHLKSDGRGGINVIDLANVETCAFIETEDLGKMYPDGRFEVLGRMDYSDIRGCNLMAL